LTDDTLAGVDQETCVKGYDLKVDKKVLAISEYEASYSGTTYPYQLTGLEANGDTRATPPNDIYG